MRREIILALFAIVTAALSIWGFKYISGQNLLTKDKTFYTVVNDAKDINTATPVLINGYQVGSVISIDPDEADIRNIIIGFQVKEKVKIPNYTKVEVRSQSPLGGKDLVLVFDKYCDGSNCAKSGDTLKGEAIGLLGSIISQDEMAPHINSITESIDRTIGKLGDPESDATLDKTLVNLSTTMENMAATTTRLSRLMSQSAGDMEKTLHNMAILTESLVNSNSKLSTILNDVGKMTADLSKVSLSQTVEKTDKTIVQAESTLKSVETTMSEATKAVTELNKLFASMDSKDSSLGLLLNDKELYENVEASTKNLDLLLQDIRLNPRRYFKVFGRKVPDYEYPQDDPASGN